MLIVEGADPKNYPEASMHVMRSRYRERFGLKSGDMDYEPFDEVMMNSRIWALDEKKSKREERRNAQNSQPPPGGL